MKVMKRFLVVAALAAASCATTPPSPTSRVKLVRDESRVDPNADQYICEREASLGTQIMDVHCRHKPELDMDHKESEIELQRPMGVGQVTVQTNTVP